MSYQPSPMLRKMPFFSVIIPLYNKETQIEATLTSVLNQSFQDFEIIVVNDGSTDNSLNKALSVKDERLQIVSTENRGVSSARNHGAGLAQSENLAFLDADDLWAPDYLAVMKSLIQRFPGCGLYASAYTILDKGYAGNAGLTVPEGIVHDYFEAELKQQISRTSATIIHAKAFRDADGFPVGMISGEDSFLFSKIAIKHAIAYAPKALVSYNQTYSSLPFRFDKTDTGTYSWFDFYEAGNFYRNEYIAAKGIQNGIRHALGRHRSTSLRMEQCFRYTVLSRTKWMYLYLLNRTPAPGIKLINNAKTLKHRYF